METAFKKEVVLLATVCFITALQSCVYINISTKKPSAVRDRAELLGSRFAATPRLEYIFTWSKWHVIVSCVASAMAVLGYQKKLPVWFFPWLGMCFYGFFTRNIPFLVKFTTALHKKLQLLPCIFLFVYIQLLVHSCCLWWEAWNVLRDTWAYRRRRAEMGAAHDKTLPEEPEDEFLLVESNSEFD